jgi:ABC-type multidrug transport system fused ATPase/permease subunit
MDEVTQQLKKAVVHENVMGLTSNNDTILGERGITLSEVKNRGFP